MIKWILFIFILATQTAWAGTTVETSPSSTEILSEENISLEITVTTDESESDIEDPKYNAPDFDEVNSYPGMSGMQTIIANGHMSVQRTQQITVVLHPKKSGDLIISNIHARVNGKIVRGEDVVIKVLESGQGSSRQRQAPTSNYYSQRNTLPKTGIQPAQGSAFFLRTEPSKRRAYKGEQIILTYALYTRTDILNIAVERYPTATGFLKEDLDIPLQQMRLQFQPTVVNGQEYNRAVLAQYAIFPVKDGQQTIDPLSGKFTFRSSRARVRRDDDPFGVFNQFFRPMEAQVDNRSSDAVKIDILPLPGAGQPTNFSGLVGDFDVTATADKVTLKTGEALNIKVKVEGKGHAGSLEHLNVLWPADFEQYEDKSRTTYFKTGSSERVFDYMLIPRVKGDFEIPPIELSMFNPDTQSYQIKKTQPISIQVLEGSGGGNIYVAKTSQGAATQANTAKQDIRYWKSGGSKSSSFDTIANFGSKGLAVASLVLLLGNLISLGRKSEEDRKKRDTKAGRIFMERVDEVLKKDSTADQILAVVENGLPQALEARFGFAAASLTRDQLKEMLSIKGATAEKCSEVDAVLERCASLRYVPAAAQNEVAIAVAKQYRTLLENLFHS